MPRRPAPEPAAPRRRRWLVIAVVGLVLATLAGPTLLSFTPIPLSFIAGALPAEAGRLGARSASLSWMGPVAVGGIELRDPQGNVIFAADRVELAGGLLGLTGGKSAPLNVRVENPRVDLAIGPSGTNFDAVIQSLQKNDPDDADPNDQSPSVQRPLNIHVIGAAARITDVTTRAQWVVDDVNLNLVDPARGIDAIELTAAGKLSAVTAPGAAAPPRGEFSVRLGEAAEGGRLARVQVKGVPLSLVDPFLQRADPTAAITGWISLDGDAAWQPKPGALASSTRPADVVRALTSGNVRSAGALQLRDVEFRGAATQGGPVRLATVDGPWRLAAAGEAIAIQQLDLTSEVGNVAVIGAVTPDEADRWATGVAMAPRDLRLASRIDLERLAAVAPQLVRLQQDARVDKGRVDFTATCKNGNVSAQLATGELAGVAGGRRVEWREPLDVRITAQQEVPTAGLAGWALQSFKAASTFFKAEASGDATRLEGEATFDLDRLADEIAPLVDLGDTRLAGAGEANFAIDRNEATRRWRLTGHGAVKDLFVGTQAAPLAQEPSLDVTAELVGSLDRLTAPPVGAIDLTAGDDVLVVTLPDSAGAAAQPFKVRLTGDAARWLRRAAVASPQIPLPETIDLAGAVEFTATGKTGALGGVLDQFTLSIKDLDLDTASLSGPRFRFQNERFEAKGSAVWDNRSREIRVPLGQLISSVASAEVTEVLIALDNPAASRGVAEFKVDLTRLDAWMPPREGPARYAASGLIGGKANLRGVPEGLQVVVNARGQRLTLVDRNPPASGGNAAAGPKQVWAEPQMKIDADVMVTPLAAQGAQPASYAVDVRDARVQAQSLSGSFGGRIADLVAMRGVEMGGGIDYDLEKLTPMLWPYVGDGVRLVGRDRVTFRVTTDESAPAGAAPISKLKARFEAPWQSADLYGLPVGGGRLGATLQRGLVQVDPLDVAVGEGRLTATAALTLDPPPETLALKPGPLVTNVAVSQQVSDRLLKYIAPVMADATRSEGKFSMSLSDFAMPLSQPTTGPPKGRAAGVLTIHQVRVLPSPAVAEWLTMARQIAKMAKEGVAAAPQTSDSPLVTIDNSQIEFQMVDGRVYHRGLQFAVGDALVQSSGSVGVDETLDLVIAIPILDEWVDRRPTYLGRMRGQAIRIPVQGTLSRPKINRDALTQLSSQLLESAAAGAIEGGLNKLLEKLKSR